MSTEEVDLGSDDESETHRNEHGKILSKYYLPPDEKGFRKCKPCIDIPPGQRSGSLGHIKVFNVVQIIVRFLIFLSIYVLGNGRQAFQLRSTPSVSPQ